MGEADLTGLTDILNPDVTVKGPNRATLAYTIKLVCFLLLICYLVSY